ncbi:MAG TPA: ATP-binding protein, partial [Chloroflexota bacterium]|nr:ATP-binding protein [Chloroflexota bacterium]
VFPSDQDGSTSLHDATRAVLESGASYSTVVETTILPRGGTLRHVAASYAYVPASNDEGPFALAVVRDVSQQKEVERLKSDFISMVSHELRTPLAVIKGYAATLLNSSLHLDAERQTRFIRGINDASDRLTRLIDNLLTGSRFESGRFKLSLQNVDLAEIVRKVVANSRTGTNGHLLHANLPSEPMMLRVDRDQIEHVLVNLVANAIKYSPEGGEITLGLRYECGPLAPADLSREDPANQRWAVLTVRDQGIGIPSHQIRFIFDKFYRGDSPAVRRVPGTGLGLYICKSIVEAHGGYIWVESQLGRGSTFYVALPEE